MSAGIADGVSFNGTAPATAELAGGLAAGRVVQFLDSRGERALSEAAMRRAWERPPYSMVIRLLSDSLPPQWARIGTRGRRDEFRQRVQQTAATMLARALRGLPACGPAPAEPPQRSIRPGWLSREISRWESRLFAEWWSIGIIDQPIDHVLRTGRLGAVSWLSERKAAAYWADPFVWPGTDLLLAEEFPLHDGPGCLVALRPPAGAGRQTWRRDQVLLDDGRHHSYPFTFQDGPDTFLLPESAADGRCALYRLTEDGRLAEFASIAERPLADATLFRHAGRLWVAATDLAIGPHDNLCLFTADRLAGPWRAHRGNPVKLDICSARPGGTPFVADGRLYRPAQDCARCYGAAVVLSEVITLTEEEFVERPILRLAPDPRGALPHGLHTLSEAGSRTLVDGKRMVLAPGLGLRKLARRLRPRRTQP